MSSIPSELQHEHPDRQCSELLGDALPNVGELPCLSRWCPRMGRCYRHALIETDTARMLYRSAKVVTARFAELNELTEEPYE